MKNAAAQLTLRDHFATAAMQGLIAQIPPDVSDNQLAEAAYLIADAMLEERKAPTA